MKQNQKLELTWIGKGEEPKLEPRILIEQPEYSYGDPNSGNMLIHGDNLLALKALEQEYAGKIKCIYIDPPYNTGNAFEHYDDGLEHSIWLNLMKPRLVLLRKLLSEDGSIWISIDDDESHYLKVLCDEVFGRKNFVSNIIWEKKSSPQNDAKWISDSHDHILAYAKNKEIWRPNRLSRTEGHNSIYKNSDAFDGIDSQGKIYGRGPWFPGDMTVKTVSQNALYPIVTPGGKTVFPAKGRAWVYFEEKFKELLRDNRITFGKSGTNKPCIKRFLSEIEDKGIVPKSVWHYKEVGENRNARQEVLKFNDSSPFPTPKPEKLIENILLLGSKQSDFILDSFLGSGTTAAVAQKMGRKWIGIELGDHSKTHCYPRLRKVVDGEQGGISKSVNWKGGGGFRFYTLAPSLLNKDKYGNWVISDKHNADMLAAAMAKQEGFKFEPDEHIYWKQGKSSEKDFIFTTTRFITVEMLDNIHDEMQPGESLLIACKAFQPECEFKFPNFITLKKIPQLLIGKCEFGKDDYSLNIVNLPGEYEKVIINEAITEYKLTEEAENIGDDFPTNLFDQ
jgi:adenine-specific DNA-methyltransferase